MDFKKIMSEMLLNIKKNEITISTELNNNSEIINKSKIGGKPIFQKILFGLIIKNFLYLF